MLARSSPAMTFILVSEGEDEGWTESRGQTDGGEASLLDHLRLEEGPLAEEELVAVAAPVDHGAVDEGRVLIELLPLIGLPRATYRRRTSYRQTHKPSKPAKILQTP